VGHLTVLMLNGLTPEDFSPILRAPIGSRFFATNLFPSCSDHPAGHADSPTGSGIATLP
jgi:hypothetical protein